MGKRVDKKVEANINIQEKLESIIFEKFKEQFPMKDLTKPEKLLFDKEGKICICPDFYSEEYQIIGEIHSHIGKLKGSQQHKIARDVLKMLLWDEHTKCVFRKYIVVCDEAEYEQLRGESALAEAIRQFGVEVVLVKLDEEDRKRLKKGMEKQNLTKKNA